MRSWTASSRVSPDYDPVAPLPPVLSGGVDAAEIGAVGQAFVHVQTGILAHAPQQIRSRFGGCPPEFVAGKEPVSHTQHSLAEQRDHFLSQRELIGGISIHVGAPQHVGPVFQQCYKPYLGESTGPSTGSRTPESLVVLFGIGDVQRAAIQTDQSPLPVPSAFGTLLRYGSHDRGIEFLQRLDAQPAARLGDAGFTGDPHLGGRIEQPLYAFQ
jgi:hypothetical protein